MPAGDSDGREKPGGSNGPGSLWLVASPIGTLDDLSPRAVRLLADVDIILAEDTRRTRKLLAHHGIQVGGRLESLHEHNELEKTERIIERIHSGSRVAVISDAGTPVLSDPGFALVRRARDAEVRVLSVPGPSAFTAALAASGQPPLPAVLVGFLPPKAGARRRRLEELARAPWTLVVLLSPHRLRRELRDISQLLGQARPATLLAELSKRHERATAGTLEELYEGAEAAAPRGEYVLVVGPDQGTDRAPRPAEAPAPEVVRLVYGEARRRGLARRDALEWTAFQLGIARRRVFDTLAAAGNEDD